MMNRVAVVLGIVGMLLSAASAQALTVTFGGADDPSLHGATGSLEVYGDLIGGSGSFDVIWSMEFAGYEGSVGDHQYLTDLGFKAFTDISFVSLDEIIWTPSTTATLVASGNVSDAGCTDTPSSAKFVCLHSLDPMVDATMGGSFEAHFTVVGDVDLTGWSYRGKFGPEDGWVISEGSTPIPEPTAALIFGLGMATVGWRVRREPTLC